MTTLHDSRGDQAPRRLAWQRVFSSDGLPDAQRYACWRDADIANLSARFDTSPHEPFAVAMDWLDLGTIGLGQARITAQDWVRRRENIARDQCDDLVVNVRHQGGARGDMAGRDLIAPGGSVVLADLAQVQAHASDASICTGFTLPRALAEQMLPASVRSLHGHVIAPDQAALLVSHLATLRDNAHHLPVTSAPALAQTVLDLFTIAVSASLGTAPADVDQRERGLLVELRETIERHLGSPSLNTTRLSRTLGVSRSTLYRLLQEEGGVQAYIRTRRLARIAESLRTAGDRQTIAMLAERWGFCDAAYLGRAFREVYGMTPGDYRAQHGVV
ncbi:helix-turn-helix domain-containing protein [Sphingomonas melonis]|uniref:helix-turn-helix domain-containing protein n=1 Tax=Sphingomonas melonis TaxID=152682 RepID=UPI00359C6849